MKPDNPYRSPDLVPLTTDFQDMKKKLKSLIVSAKAYQAATLKVEDARAKVSNFQYYNLLLLLFEILKKGSNFVFVSSIVV